MQLWGVRTRMARESAKQGPALVRPISRVKGGILGWLRVGPFYKSRST